MLQPGALAAIRLVLASASPRRVELVRDNLGLSVEVCPSLFEETLLKADFPDARAYCQATARGKALEVAARCCFPRDVDQLVIAADTVVSLDGHMVMEKPRDKGHAAEMLRSLSGSQHSVITAAALIFIPAEGGGTARERLFAEVTRVRFSKLSEGVVAAYVASGEPMDKAGGYGIQGKGGTLVEGIEGCYFNVVGLPINALSREIIALLGLEES
ncbi:Maf-like protein [Pavlovales sp. CCMP2436]|nr:Maf-like protein [Pavlovales sp. CCMP2436]